MLPDTIRTPLKRCVKCLLCLLQGWFCSVHTSGGVTAVCSAPGWEGTVQHSALRGIFLCSPTPGWIRGNNGLVLLLLAESTRKQ